MKNLFIIFVFMLPGLSFAVDYNASAYTMCVNDILRMYANGGYKDLNERADKVCRMYKRFDDPAHRRRSALAKKQWQELDYDRKHPKQFGHWVHYCEPGKIAKGKKRSCRKRYYNMQTRRYTSP